MPMVVTDMGVNAAAIVDGHRGLECLSVTPRPWAILPLCLRWIRHYVSVMAKHLNKK